jgi:hypothetical protein
MWNRDKPRETRDKPRRALYSKQDKKEIQNTATSGNVYLWKDPKGPLAPEEGQRPYSTVLQVQVIALEI